MHACVRVAWTSPNGLCVCLVCVLPINVDNECAEANRWVIVTVTFTVTVTLMVLHHKVRTKLKGRSKWQKSNTILRKHRNLLLFDLRNSWMGGLGENEGANYGGSWRFSCHGISLVFQTVIYFLLLPKDGLSSSLIFCLGRSEKATKTRLGEKKAEACPNADERTTFLYLKINYSS